MIEISKGKPRVRLFLNDRNDIEGTALTQLETAARLGGIEAAAGMPDLHPGNGCPVGAAFISRPDIFYPHLIGSDMGCGMGFWKTTIRRQRIKQDKWIKKLSGLERMPDDGTDCILKNEFYDLAKLKMGTIGGGNHFAELQVLEALFDEEEFSRLNLDRTHLCILVHSGSRGIGEAILHRHTANHRAAGLCPETPDGREYLRQYREAVEWARANRASIAKGFARVLGGSCSPVLDLCHNSISPIHLEGHSYWLHRKGLTPSDQGAIVIPGSRGTLTYLVKPLGNQTKNLRSLPHGAGRKWNRKSCKARLKGKYTKKDLSRTRLGSRIVSSRGDTLFQEAPQAYKNIESVINTLENQELIRLIASFRPLITYK